jgi:hypothetical protein
MVQSGHATLTDGTGGPVFRVVPHELPQITLGMADTEEEAHVLTNQICTGILQQPELAGRPDEGVSVLLDVIDDDGQVVWSVAWHGQLPPGFNDLLG